MRTRTLVTAALAAALFLATSAPAGVKPEAKRTAAHDFNLKDADGKAVKLSDYKGKTVLLNFWATWCGPCKLEMPWFVEFQQTYKDKGFVVLGVAMDDEGWNVVKPFLQTTKVNYRMVAGNEEVAQKYGGVDSLPTSFLIDTNGKIASTHVGLVSKSEYVKDIKALLGIK